MLVWTSELFLIFLKLMISINKDIFGFLLLRDPWVKRDLSVKFFFDYWNEWVVAVVNLVYPLVLWLHHVVVCLHPLVGIPKSDFYLYFFCKDVV